MAAKLNKAYGVDAELFEGSGGIFDVKCADELVYSKHQTGEFPDEQALLTSLQGRLG